MGKHPLRIGLLLVVAALVVIGAWLFARSGGSPSADPEDESPVPISSAPQELAPAPRKAGPSDPGTTGEKPTGPASDAGPARVVRRVRIKLANGSDAPSGRVYCAIGDFTTSNSLIVGSGPVQRADIVAGAPVEFTFEKGVAFDSYLIIAVPGRPVHTASMDSKWPTEIVVPDGVMVRGLVVDRSNRAVADLPLTAIDSWDDHPYETSDAFELERRVESFWLDESTIHSETRTDGSGRFHLQLPRLEAYPRPWIRFISGDPRWFVRSGKFASDLTNASAIEFRLVAEPGAALDVRVMERLTGEPVARAYLRWTYPMPNGGFQAGFSLPATPHPVTRLTFPRMVSPSEELSIEISATVPAATARGRVPSRQRVTIPAGVSLAAVEFRLEPELAPAEMAHVELTVPGGNGTPGAKTPWSLEVLTVEGRVERADIVDTTTWAAADRIDADLPPGTWTLRLLPENRTRWDYEARVTLASRVTSKILLTRIDHGPRPGSVRLRAGPRATVKRVGVRGPTGDWRETLDGHDAVVAAIPPGEYSLIVSLTVNGSKDNPDDWRVVRPITVRAGEETLVVVDE